MNTSPQKIESILTLWNEIDEDRKRKIFYEFMAIYRGTYTQQFFLAFLEKKLLLEAGERQRKEE